MTKKTNDDEPNCVMLADGFVYLRWTASEVTEKNAASVHGQIASLTGGRTYPLLIELGGVRRVKLQIEALLGAAPLPVSILAIAASSPVDWATAYFYVSKVPATCTIRLFTSRPEAEAWLKAQPGVAS